MANFVETEQLVEHDDVMTSFVQTRGGNPSQFFMKLIKIAQKTQPTYINKTFSLLPEDVFQSCNVKYGLKTKSHGYCKNYSSVIMKMIGKMNCKKISSSELKEIVETSYFF